MPHRRALKALWHNSAVVALLLASLSSAALVYVVIQYRDDATRDAQLAARQSTTNRQLLTQIQRARLRSCIQTYGSFRDVFRPFFRPASQRTKEEARDIRKFLRQIEKFQKRCPQQTGVTDQGRQP